MANDLVVKGSIGARIEMALTLDGEPFDLTGAEVSFLYRKPGGTTGAWSAEPADAAGGLARFVTSLAATLDTVGRWELQARVETAAGETLYGDAVPFHVTEALG